MLSASAPGGATTIGSGHRTRGKSLGPKRGASPFALRLSALSTFSGVIGTSSTRTPTASYTAFATAGMTGSSGPWPASLAPNGPLGSGCSTMYVTTSHISSVVGLLYSSRLGILCTTLRLPRYAISSISASPSPMYTEPSICPITVAALMARPTSCAIQILGTRTMPVAGSTSTSATQALWEYAGDGPTPAPRYFPGEGGGVYEPTVPTVPSAASASRTASANESPSSGRSRSNTRPSANPTRSTGTASCAAACLAISARARSAAWIAA